MSFPEKRLIKRTITLRELDIPEDIFLTKQSMIRWLCFSLGLINENESRDTTVRVLDAFFEIWFRKKTGVDVEEIAEKSGIPEKTVRYNMDKLRNIGMVVLDKGRYYLVEDFDRHVIELVSKILENSRKVLFKLSTDI